MSACSTPTKTIKTYPVQEDPVTICEFMSEWEECGDGCSKDGYSKDDGVFVCINGTKHIARSLVDNNTDSPMGGATAVPATWEVKTLAQWLFN